MEVILLEKIANLGSLGQVVNVRSGYARNYLVPQRKAKVANATNLEEFEKIRASLEAAEAKTVAAATARKDKLDGMEIMLTANAGQEGKLFGSITNVDIADAIVANDVEVERREVRMPDGPIRSIGIYDIAIHLHTDVEAIVKVTVASEDGDTGVVAEVEEAETEVKEEDE